MICEQQELVASILIGIFAGIISSLISHVLLRFSKPRIKIAKQIAKSKKGSGYEYRFKIVNLSRSYAKNVRIQFEMVTDVIGKGGTISRVIPISLVRDNIDFIDEYRKKDKNANYAVRFAIKDDLEDIWVDDEYSYLRLKFYCENESSGCGKVFVQKYEIKSNSIKEGAYEFGKSCEIVSR